jgi:hypothetical protein
MVTATSEHRAALQTESQVSPGMGSPSQTTNRLTDSRRHTQQQSTAQPNQTARRLPDILRAATQQRGGWWARLHRFATAMSYPTLSFVFNL